MIRWKSGVAAAACLILAVAGAQAATVQHGHAASGVGSCPLKNWNPGADPDDAKDLPEGQRTQTYKPDDFDCTGAKFADRNVEFAKFPQPHNFAPKAAGTMNAAAVSNPLAPYFPPFTHFVLLYRENHTF